MTETLSQLHERLRSTCTDGVTWEQSRKVDLLIGQMDDMNMSSQLVDQVFAAAVAYINVVQRQKRAKKAEVRASVRERAKERARKMAVAWGGAPSYHAMIAAKRERNEEIYREWLDGISQTELAKKHELSTGRISQIITTAERKARSMQEALA